MIKRGLRRPKEPEASREDFLRAALELFGEKGYHNTSLDDVILRAKRSKGGFYHHFGCKSELFLEMFEDLIEKSFNGLEKGLQGDLPLKEVMKNHFKTLNEKKLANTPHIKAVVELYLLAIRDKDVLKMIRRVNSLGICLFKKFLERSVRRGEIRPLGRKLGERAELLYHSSRGVLIMEVILNDGKNPMSKMIRFMEWEMEKMRMK